MDLNGPEPVGLKRFISRPVLVDRREHTALTKAKTSWLRESFNRTLPAVENPWHDGPPYQGYTFAKRGSVLSIGLVLGISLKETRLARGRFIALYLGLRRMMRVSAPQDRLHPLGSDLATPSSKIEAFLDKMYTKTHREEPYVVLTAPFGGRRTEPYSARTSARPPGHGHGVNNWRNNLGIQKGIGCNAEVEEIKRVLPHPQRRLACRHMRIDADGQHRCGIVNTRYRGDAHSVWLRRVQDGGGYQVVDLDHPAVYEDHLLPEGAGGPAIPIFPLISALYCCAQPGVYPHRRGRIGIPHFAADFSFRMDHIRDLFNCDPESPRNSELLAQIADTTIPLEAPAHARPIDEADPAELPEEPSETLLNTGLGAELAVARELQAHGWQLHYRGNQRGIGYDLEASREGSVLRVEVKSSVGFADLELHESEWYAAQRYGQEFVLAAVDFFGTAGQQIWYIRDPASTAAPTERSTQLFRFQRSDLAGFKTEPEFL